MSITRPSESSIVLLAINARYRHTSIGLRCLKANLGPLDSQTQIVETTLQQTAQQIVEAVLARQPQIVGLGVYIWNAALSLEVVTLLKRTRPDLVVVLGGPEVSYETQEQAIVSLADYTVCGEGEQAFAQLCAQLMRGERPQPTVLAGTTPPLDQLRFPYPLYTPEDIAHRVIYVEASRGCPYKCQFCLSSLDRAVRVAPMEAFFEHMDALIARGARNFKFIDRTFNLRIDTSLAILNFFWERYLPGMSLHFEMVPDRLPTPLREALAEFPPGSVQLEIGIQTFDPATSARIQRRQNVAKLEDNLRFLKALTHVHLHTDLIVGLPGEDLPTFGRGFDRLIALEPHEIQVGILKRLKGTPIVMHTAEFHMRYNPEPPFDVLSTRHLSAEQLTQMKRFSRYWDLVANNGNFVLTVPLIWRDQPSAFQAFMTFSQWLYQQLETTHHISLNRLTRCLLDYLVVVRGLPEERVGSSIFQDFHRTPGRRTPRFLKPFATQRGSTPTQISGGLARQARHAAN